MLKNKHCKMSHLKSFRGGFEMFLGNDIVSSVHERFFLQSTVSRSFVRYLNDSFHPEAAC